MSDVPHSRKSRLSVPSGGDSLPNSISSSGAGGGGVSSSDPLSSSSSSGMNIGSGGGGGGMGGTGNSSGMISPTLRSTTRTLLPSSQHHHHHSYSHHHHSHHHHGISSMSMSHYFQRLLDISQMDIQSALDQMKTLISTRPQAVYKTAYYRKQTKNHWYRDDPAFITVQIIFLFIASIAYSVACKASLFSSISFIVTSIVWNFILVGCIMATICREIANRHLNTTTTTSNNNSSNGTTNPMLATNNSSSGTGGGTSSTTKTSTALHVRQQVEWLYAFDIHCNSFFPVFVILYGLQFFALPVALGENYVPLFISNTLYVTAFSYYWYITHLGYRALPFLHNTEIFLIPILGIVLLYLIILIVYPITNGTLFNYNATRIMATFYFFSE